MKRVITTLAALASLVALSAAQGCPEDTHPNAPQQPGPNRGGPVAQPPKTPSPAPGDPKPEPTKSPDPTRDLKLTVHFDGQRSISVLMVIAGKSQRETAKGTKPMGNTITWPGTAPVGSVVSITATPTLDKERKGDIMVWIDAVNPDQTVCASPLASTGGVQCVGAVPKTK